MRIISGKYKGHPIVAPKTDATRPTTDKAREAVFNILTHASWSRGIVGARVIDMFAGSGALGLEALSRGAEFCVFIETAASARGAIRSNIEALAVFGQTRLQKRDATRLGRRPAGVGGAFDLAFLDPPYGKGLVPRALEALALGEWLADGAIVYVETGPKEELGDLPDGFRVLESRQTSSSTCHYLVASAPIERENT